MNPEAQTVRVEPTAEMPKRIAVKGLSRLATFIRGKEILILGPGSVGKSKFAQYLRLAALDPEGKREMTYAVTKSPAFVVDVAGQQGPVLRVRRTVDTPGQVGPLQHALLVARRRPHAVVVILDCGDEPRNTLRWFCLFCNALDSVLRKVPPVARRLQEMVVVLNKRDKIADKELDRLREAVTKALERFLVVAWGPQRVKEIPILECVSVQTDIGSTLIDVVIAQLAARLSGRQNPPGAPGPKLIVAPPAGPEARPPGKPVPAGRQNQPGAKPAAAPPAAHRLYPPRLSHKPLPSPLSPPVRRQNPQGAPTGSKPVVAPAAIPIVSPSRPSYKPAPTPLSPPARRQDQPSAAPGLKPPAVPPAGSHLHPLRPLYRPAVTPLSPPKPPAPATPPAETPKP